MLDIRSPRPSLDRRYGSGVLLWSEMVDGRPVQIRRYADRGLLVDVGDVDALTGLQAHLTDRMAQWQVRYGWTTALVHGASVEELVEAVRAADDHVVEEPAETEPHVIDVVYDGIDLPVVAEHAGCSVDEVVALHTAAEYRVVLLGFTRGFPYLAGLHPRLTGVPRLATPRTLVPARAVAITGAQAGVYPTAGPGGWRLLGTATADLFDATCEPPTPLHPGLRVRFRRVG
jgi:KipI family sensor histidine kinase inhibitor